MENKNPRETLYPNPEAETNSAEATLTLSSIISVELARILHSFHWKRKGSFWDLHLHPCAIKVLSACLLLASEVVLQQQGSAVCFPAHQRQRVQSTAWLCSLGD